MKIVKYLFLLILLVSIAATVFIATQEGKYDIKKERIIKVPRQVLFNYINDYRNWEYVGILTNNDTTAVFSYSKNTSGKGAVASWKKGNTAGTVKTLKVMENDSILQSAVIDSQPSDIAWGFTESGVNTKVSVRLKGSLNFRDKAFALLYGGVDDKLESMLDQGLENLDVFLVQELKNYTVDVKNVVQKTGTYYLKQTATAPTADVMMQAGTMLPRLMAFVKTNKIVTNGAPFILYTGFDPTAVTTTFAVCVPIKEEIFTAPGSEFEGRKLEPFNALKTTLKGDYSHIGKAWDKARKHINTNALPENIDGQYLEIFTRNIQQTKRPSGWITDLYIPIGPRTGNTTAVDSVDVPVVVPIGTTAPRPATTARPATTTPRPAATTSTAKPATSATAKPSGTTAKPAATSTAKPATPTAKPSGAATAKPAAAKTAAPAGTPKTTTTTTQKTTAPASTVKPAAKPAATIPAKPKTPAKTPPPSTIPEEFN